MSKRKVIEFDCCPICNQDTKDDINVLRMCHATMDVWENDGSPLTKWSSDGWDVWEFVKEDGG